MKELSARKHLVALSRMAGLIMTFVLALGPRTNGADIASNFTIVNHATGQPMSLYDFKGSVILLDFWAYWCGPCQAAASDIEQNVTRYYVIHRGNPNGVPVTLISISIDTSDPAAENSYIQTYRLGLVGDDADWSAFNQYNQNAIPQFVVINGTTNSVNYAPWQILSSPYGYLTNSTVPNLKAYINSVQTPAPVCTMASPVNDATVVSSNVTLQASVTTNGKIIKDVAFYSGATLLGSVTTPPYSITWSNVPPGARSVFVRASYGTSSSVDSPVDNFTVKEPAPIAAQISRQGNRLILSWTGGTGIYQVQTSSNLSNTNWQSYGATVTNTSMVIDQSNHAGFYRVTSPY